MPKDSDVAIAEIVRKSISDNRQFAVLESSALGGYAEYARPDTKRVLGMLASPKKLRSPTILIKGGKVSWWAKYGAQARKYARENHIPGPNIRAVAPILTPDLVEDYEYEEYSLRDMADVDQIIKKSIRILLDRGAIVEHPIYKGFYRSTGKD